MKAFAGCVVHIFTNGFSVMKCFRDFSARNAHSSIHERKQVLEELFASSVEGGGGVPFLRCTVSKQFLLG